MIACGRPVATGLESKHRIALLDIRLEFIPDNGLENGENFMLLLCRHCYAGNFQRDSIVANLRNSMDRKVGRDQMLSDQHTEEFCEAAWLLATVSSAVYIFGLICHVSL